ncbi:hypothetical protein JCGZ_22016 [Jatropha curcas]|uniref:Uncharacterized protein n=1 Tax=Jatropha curcas TaxID=180498 RepID=A0A067JNF7_JATCU|nr:hypothetical protein JCGZ_22016 [Jatropha curcas]
MENFWSFYTKKMDSKKCNLSSCFLIEASGDSEVDFDPNNKPSKDIASVDDDDDDDDDDAESCSCDVSYYCCYYSCVGDFNGCEVKEEPPLHSNVNNNKNNIKEEQEQEKEEIKVDGCQKWSDGLSVNQKSRVSVDESDNEQMNEKEKNKLFWETCLAS